MATLNGATIDDGLPAGAFTIAWSKISGPGQVTFGSTNLANTSVTLSAAGTYVLRLTANDGEFGSSDDVTVTVTNPSSATPGGIFITGHHPDFHSVDGPNTTGARHIIQRAIEFVTFNKPSPRILLVTDLRNPGSGFIDPRLGMQVSGFTTFDVADFGSGTAGALNLRCARWSQLPSIDRKPLRGYDPGRYSAASNGAVRFIPLTATPPRSP